MYEGMKKAGWNFPVTLDYQTGKIKTTDLKSDIRQSLLILLSTTPGERLIHGDYGCNLSQFMFEPITYELLRKIRYEVLSAVARWEKRISNVDVDILNDANEDSRIVIGIKYMIHPFFEIDEVYYAYELK